MANPNLMNATTMYGKTYTKLITTASNFNNMPYGISNQSVNNALPSRLDNDTSDVSLLIKNPVGSNDIYRINNIKRTLLLIGNSMPEYWWIIYSKYKSSNDSYDHQYLYTVYDADTTYADATTTEIFNKDNAFYLEEGDKLSATTISVGGNSNYISLVINYDIITDE